MNFSKVPTTGKFIDAATAIDSNFTKAEIELLKIKNATLKNVGYYETYDLLVASGIVPEIGNTASVGVPYPGYIYDCLVAGTWHQTDIPSRDLLKGDKGDDGVDLTANVVELCLDFETLESFDYKAPSLLKFTSMICESTEPTLSIALNTEIEVFTMLRITPTAIGMVILKGVTL